MFILIDFPLFLQVYKLKDTYLDGQVRFSKALRSFKESIEKYENNRESKNLMKSHSTQSTFEVNLVDIFNEVLSIHLLFH